MQVAVSRANNTRTFFQRYVESSTTIPNPDLGMETATSFDAEGR